MDDDIMEKFNRISEIFREKFQSREIQQQNKEYLKGLYDQLNRWKSRANEQMSKIIEEKIEEIEECYRKYCRELDEKYARLIQQRENNNSLSELNDQLDDFNIYCQSNAIQQRIRLNTTPYTGKELTDKVHVEYVPYIDVPPSTTFITLQPAYKRRSDSPSRLSPAPVRNDRLPVYDDADEFVNDNKPSARTFSGSSKEELSTYRKKPYVRPATDDDLNEFANDDKPSVRTFSGSSKEELSTYRKKPNVRPARDDDLNEFVNDDKPSVRTFSGSSKEELSTYRKKPNVRPATNDDTNEIVNDDEPSIRSSFSGPSKEEPPIYQKKPNVRPTTDDDLNEFVNDDKPSARSFNNPSQEEPPIYRKRPNVKPTTDDDDLNEFVNDDKPPARSFNNPSKEEPPIYQKKPNVRPTTDDDAPKNSTRMYVGRHNILTPVLIDKNREVYNNIKNEQLTEYCIDSIQIPPDNQQQASTTNPDINDDATLVRAYKVLIKKEDDYQKLSRPNRDDEQQADVNNIFQLEQYDHSNFATILFEKCETLYNCISSSTKRNELLVYNSKLKVLMVLHHEYGKKCRDRFYLQWSNSNNGEISDITYCHKNDQFFISTWDTRHLYLFNRDSLSITDLGQFPKGKPLRRIHCYGQTIYCILGGNFLHEYELDEQNSNLTLKHRMKVVNPKNPSEDTTYHLLDVTCNEDYLLIVYAPTDDEVRLQSIYRKTRKLHSDFKLDANYPINQAFIRIESTNENNGNCIYLNGSQKHLKSIDFANFDKGKVTSTLRGSKKPTNLCFLNDGRLVVLYEEPYFLSIHDLKKRQEGYKLE